MITLTTYLKAVSKGVLILALFAGVVFPHAAEAQQTPSDTGATSGGGTAVQGTGQTSVVQTLQGWLNRLVPANTGTPGTAGNPGSGADQSSGGTGFWNFVTGGNNSTHNSSANSSPNWFSWVFPGAPTTQGPNTSNAGGTGGGAGSGGATTPGSVQAGGGWGGSTVDAALDQGGSAINGFLNFLTSFGHSPVGQFFSDLFAPAVDATRGVVDTVVEGAVETGVNVSNWVFRSNTTNPGQTPIENLVPPGGRIEVTTDRNTGAQYTTVYDSYGNIIMSNNYKFISDFIPPGGRVEVTFDPATGEKYTTIYDENGNAVRSDHPRFEGAGSGPSIPGASKGTVGNPFSDGTDKTDAESSNKEDTSNPYLFEYDPSSTNNNPKGDDAIEQ